MRITIEKAALKNSLDRVLAVAEKRGPVAILGNVLLAAHQGVFTITATDMEIAIVERVDCQMATTGRTTVHAQTFAEIVRRLPDGATVTLELSQETETLNLTSERFNTKIRTTTASDFPEVTAGTFPVSFRMPSADLKAMIGYTRYAISTETTRYYLNGLFFHRATNDTTGKTMLRGVATDGHRLALYDAELPVGADKPDFPSVIIPRKVVGELYKILDGGESEVVIDLSDTRIRFSCGPTTVTSKLIDGTFPEYGRVIPTQTNTVLRFKQKEFNLTVARVSAISTERSRPVTLRMSDAGVTIMASHPEQGTAQEEMEREIADYSGAEELVIGFQSGYLTDAASQMGTNTEFHFTNSMNPVLIREVGNANLLSVLMPVRI